MNVPTLVAGFRDGLARGELLIQKCGACGKFNMYPRYACPFCQSDSLGWHRASGKGSLVSFTVLRMGAPEGFEGDLPYGLGVVRLDEGVQLLVRLVADADGDWRGYRCDDPVVLEPMPADKVAQRPCAWFKRAGR